MQSRLMSLIESLTNVAIGMVVSFFGQIVVSHWYNLPLNLAQNMQIVMFFTVLSVLSSYFVRRWYNRKVRVHA